MRRIERYGVEFHRVWDSHGKNIELGVSGTAFHMYAHTQSMQSRRFFCKGRAVSVHRAGLSKTRINTFAWCRILRVFYKRKQFFIQLQREKVNLDLNKLQQNYVNTCFVV